MICLFATKLWRTFLFISSVSCGELFVLFLVWIKLAKKKIQPDLKDLEGTWNMEYLRRYRGYNYCLDMLPVTLTKYLPPRVLSSHKRRSWRVQSGFEIIQYLCDQALLIHNPKGRGSPHCHRRRRRKIVQEKARVMGKPCRIWWHSPTR